MHQMLPLRSEQKKKRDAGGGKGGVKEARSPAKGAPGDVASSKSAASLAARSNICTMTRQYYASSNVSPLRDKIIKGRDATGGRGGCGRGALHNKGVRQDEDHA